VCVTKTTTSSSPPSTISHIFGGSLPFTGSSIIVPGTILGLILVGIGFFFVLIGRRRRDDDEADEAIA
jgi:LPXTG-motif cell wall-anchored protein